MSISRSPSRQDRPADKRKRLRAKLQLKGKLFDPERGFEEDCQILDFSPDGAGVKSAILAPRGRRMVLYVDGFGRFEGTVVGRDRTRLGLQFRCSPAKRDRTAEQLKAFVADGTTTRVPLRSALRVGGVPPLHGFTFAGGRHAHCEVIDIALGGALLKTDVRPEVGESIGFGGVVGVVVRHTDDGIAVQFTRRQAADATP